MARLPIVAIASVPCRMAPILGQTAWMIEHLSHPITHWPLSAPNNTRHAIQHDRPASCLLNVPGALPISDLTSSGYLTRVALAACLPGFTQWREICLAQLGCPWPPCKPNWLAERHAAADAGRVRGLAYRLRDRRLTTTQ